MPVLFNKRGLWLRHFQNFKLSLGIFIPMFSSGDYTHTSDLLRKFTEKNYKSSSPGISVHVGKCDTTVFEYANGGIEELNLKFDKDTVYDLASLTKPISTAMLTMKLIERGEIALEDTMGTLGIYPSNDAAGNLTVRSLISHSSGLIPDYPLYKFGKDRESYKRAIASFANSKPIYKEERYSDLNYMLLAFTLEEIAGMTLDKLMEKEIINPLGLKNTAFNPTFPKERIAPTETTVDRGQVWGKVHDEKSYWLGGVAGHAGLFSNLPDVVKMVKAFMEGRIVTRNTMDLMVSPANKDIGGMFGLGWMTNQPRPADPSPAYGFSQFMGDYAPYGAIGHTGFTGPSICMDLKSGVYAIILSNRVYPTRDNIGILRFRRLFHNLVFSNLGNGNRDGN